MDGKAPEFVAFWLRKGRVLAGMNANVWDVQDDIQKLVRAGYAGAEVDKQRLGDPAVPIGDLATVGRLVRQLRVWTIRRRIWMS